MRYLGVDVGLGSVRCMLLSGDVRVVHTEPITINHHPEDRHIVTQSSREIFNGMVRCMQQVTKAASDEIGGVSVAATCSMVVREVLEEKDGHMMLGPYNGDQDIVMWMDSRCHKQCEDLNQNLPKEVLLLVGGAYIPEMGLPKLKWLSENTKGPLVCFELHEWIAHLLTVGHGGVVPYKHQNGISDVAIDGSIKGWSLEFLQLIGIRSGVLVGGYGLDRTKGMQVGDVMAPMSSQLAKRLGIASPLVYYGCIDSYAGWAATSLGSEDDDNCYSNTVSMVAGTSTCFVMVSDTYSIPGIWGPFLVANRSVLSFGQPATGRLFELLFEKYHELNPTNKDWFSLLEEETQRLERTHGQSISSLLRWYFYYGDVFGNRTPFNDVTMAEACIDGANSPGLRISILHDRTMASVAVQYNLIMEFLVFQTHLILGMVSPVSAIVVSGSQAANGRFLQLLATVTEKTVISAATASAFQVVEGSCAIARLGAGYLRLQNRNLSRKEISPRGALPRQKKYEPQPGSIGRLLRNKSAANGELARAQRAWRAQMSAFDAC